MISTVRTVDEYVGRLSIEQQDVIATIRDLILRNLPKGFQESMTWGVPTYEVPLERYPDTYNGKPLSYAALAAKKNYYTLHLMSVYSNPQLLEWLQSEFKRRGKRLNIGKACLRFKRLDDLPLDVMAEMISKTTLDEYVARIEAGRQQQERQKRERGSHRPSARKPARRAKTTSKSSVRKISKPATRTKTAKKRARSR
ncbi:MAG TPA: DUF1801 domain-containing protein [Vicinamibacterales bacterium]|jgi:hypothetical protein|nr:DUF1801 domain-containing protein [Vicinamibacterales bacterium]